MGRTQVFVTSDWHLGGSLDRKLDDGSVRLGTSIFRSVDALNRFLDEVGDQAKSFNGSTDLVINGDMIDFLAPDPDDDYIPIAWQSDASLVRTRLDQIVAKNVDERGCGPFDALRDLTAAGVRATIMLGNHDIELSLPSVRDHLEKLVAGDSGNARFLFDGEALSIGRMLIEHGNRYDPVNAIDYSKLRQERSHLSRGFSVDDSGDASWFFCPPPGSMLVVDQINPRLESIPFINLLKPEIEASVPLLIAFYPEIRTFLDLLFRKCQIACRSHEASYKNHPGYLSSDREIRYQSLNHFLDLTLGEDAEPFRIDPAIAAGLSTSAGGSGSARRQLKNFSVLDRDQTCPWDFYNKAKRLKETMLLKGVRNALRKCNDLAKFSTAYEDPTYLQAAETMVLTGKYDVVCFGHTHHAKEVSVGDGKGKYLNSGTWADAMRLPQGISSTDRDVSTLAIEKFLTDMQHQNYDEYIERPLGYIHGIVEADGSVNAKLKFFGDADGRIGGFEDD